MQPSLSESRLGGQRCHTRSSTGSGTPEECGSSVVAARRRSRHRVHVATVDRLIRWGVLTPARRFAAAQLSRGQVEHLALTTRTVRQLVAGDYWVTLSNAAVLLGRSATRVQQLTNADRLPHVVHLGKSWKLYRRQQLAVIRRARQVRFGDRSLERSHRPAAVGREKPSPSPGRVPGTASGSTVVSGPYVAHRRDVIRPERAPLWALASRSVGLMTSRMP